MASGKKRNPMNPEKSLAVFYRFTLPNLLSEEFELRIHPKTLILISPIPDNPPDWARLGFHQCSNCPLSEKKTRFCPVAVNLTEIVRHFERLTSHDEIFVEVITEERIYYKKTSAQRGISSLMGLMIAVSSCPVTDFFKPMARFHLPFSSEEETAWRAVSTYLISRYFLEKEQVCVNFDLSELRAVYSRIQKLNTAIAKRLRAACEEDSTVNAIIILDVFAKSLPQTIEKSLLSLKSLFEPILRGYS
jgi:hypothetical protein